MGKFGSTAAQGRYDVVIAEWLAKDRQFIPETTELTIAELILACWRFAESYYRKNGRTTDELNGIKVAMRPLNSIASTLLFPHAN